MRDRDSVILESLYHTILENNSMDAKYAELERRARGGDEITKEEVREMVDEAAKKAGYDSGYYHGTDSKFNEFKLSHFGKTDDGYYGEGFYITSDKDYAEGFGRYVMPIAVKSENPLILPESSSSNDPSIYDARDILAEIYDKPELKTNRTIPDTHEIVKQKTQYGYTIYKLSPKGNIGEFGPAEESELAAVIKYHDQENGINVEDSFLNQLLKDFGRRSLLNVAIQKGYDSIQIIDPEDNRIREIILNDPTKLKSADPFTYDDNGGLIPLSQRFDSSKNDIRY